MGGLLSCRKKKRPKVSQFLDNRSLETRKARKRHTEDTNTTQSCDQDPPPPPLNTAKSMHSTNETQTVGRQTTELVTSKHPSKPTTEYENADSVARARYHSPDSTLASCSGNFPYDLRDMRAPPSVAPSSAVTSTAQASETVRNTTTRTNTNTLSPAATPIATLAPRPVRPTSAATQPKTKAKPKP